MTEKLTTGIVSLVIALSVSMVVRAQSPDARYPFIRDDKVGFIDYQGREVIPPRFYNVGDMAHFHNGLACVGEPEKGWGYIDPSGSFVIGPSTKWAWGRAFHEGVAAVMILGDPNQPAWINDKGEIIFTGMGTEGAYFSEGLMPMRNSDGKYGFVNKKFKYVIPPTYDLAFEFEDGRAQVWLNDKWGFVDLSGKVVVDLKYDWVSQFSDGLAHVRVDTAIGVVETMEGRLIAENGRHGFVDKSGNEVIGLQFDEVTSFVNGLAFAAPASLRKFGIIDKHGAFVVQPQFDSALEFHEGLAVVQKGERFGFVDTSGKRVIPPKFTHADSFQNGLARVAWDPGISGYIDKTGKVIWSSKAKGAKD